MSDKLREIQRDMAFMGWKGDPERGFSHKEDVNGNVIAYHHDATWLADFDESADRVERLAVIHEIERRAALCICSPDRLPHVGCVIHGLRSGQPVVPARAASGTDARSGETACGLDPKDDGPAPEGGDAQ